MTTLLIVSLILTSSFGITSSASSCYSCNPCGTTWNPAVATVIQTSNPTDYCRKTITGSLVVKDSTSSCTPVNILSNGVYCCQVDLCNTANQCSSKMIHLGIVMSLLCTILNT